jgi:(1->4)-alpha-D-glucan 1-alpha-D-glucosylmutase
MIRAPISTYRLQMHAGFGFADARAIVEYLGALGITDVYTSPYLRAEKGSTHGYNLVAHDQLNPELGDREAYDRWTSAMQAAGMGHILDVVPNHMGIATGENAWWNDVLENGPASLYADHFDIEWSPPKPSLKDKVLLPILGAQYGTVLENGELTLVREGGRLLVVYYDHHLPVSPRTWIAILEHALTRLALPSDDPARTELESVAFHIKSLPAAPPELAREKEVAKRRLDGLLRDSAPTRTAVDAAVSDVNGVKGDASSFDRLDAVLREQHYRLSDWHVAKEEINYRRFFDINTLAAVRMESPAVFEAAHALVFRLLEEGKVTGLRLDHTDGLYDPADYFRQLQAHGGRNPDDEALYLVAEKILEPKEKLPPSWLVEGTTGYDFLASVNGLWVDPRAEAPLTQIYGELTGQRARYADLVHDSKRAIMRASLSSEMHMLAQQLERIAEADRRSRDFTVSALYTAVVQTVASFPVYRTYIRADGSREPNDDHFVVKAIRDAKRRTPELNGSVFDFLREVLLLHGPQPPNSERARFAMRFQQLTGPVMAKGVEDTTFYRYLRMVSLNEVGASPARFGTTVAEFHAQNEERLARWPLAMTATSTHDTKRGEDVRARLAVLSEIPEEWRERVVSWTEIAKAHRTVQGEGDEEETLPTKSDEYLFFQTAVGMPDPEPDRVVAYMAKAAKEAKDKTSWVNPDEAYDAALEKLVRGMLADATFRAQLARVHARIEVAGATNGLAQTVLKLASPGVADTYQGSESYNYDLVDPDNRRRVDYESLSARLAELRARATDPRSRVELAAELLGRYADGDVKLFVTHRALVLRREHAELFQHGDYVALGGEVQGRSSEHVVAFKRSHGGRSLVCAVPRFSLQLTQGSGFAVGKAWEERSLVGWPRGTWSNAFTGEVLVVDDDRVPLAQVFARFPVALFLDAADAGDPEAEGERAQ